MGARKNGRARRKMFGTCCAFYCPKATVFAASDVTIVYGVTSPFQSEVIISIHETYSNLICCKTGLTVSAVVKCATSLLQSFYDNFSKQVARF